MSRNPLNHPLNRSGTTNNGVAYGPGMSKTDIELDQYNQLGNVRNIHTGDEF